MVDCVWSEVPFSEPDDLRVVGQGGICGSRRHWRHGGVDMGRTLGGRCKVGLRHGPRVHGTCAIPKGAWSVQSASVLSVDGSDS